MSNKLKIYKKVCVLIRVYNRTADLKHCVDIIRDTWTNNEYHIIITTNGLKDGYELDDSVRSKSDHVVEIENNIGHFKGNSQLLLQGLPVIPDDCDYTVILEADTWLYGDLIVKKYIALLEEKSAVWASAQFFSYVRNLATDFAIVKTSFVKSHPEVFTFSGTPEYYVGNYLHELGERYIYIKENMPVNLPKYIRKFPFAPTGRFFAFPNGKMVTHHIETLKGGMEEKKFYFNVVSGTNYFTLNDKRALKWNKFKMKLFMALSFIFPYKSWFFKTKISTPY